MIGTVYFYHVPGSVSSCEYPLLVQASDFSYTHKVEKVKFTEDLEQTIIVPTFTGWSDCNMVRLVPDSEDTEDYPSGKMYYWITDLTRSSISGSAVEFVISFNAPTSLLYGGNSDDAPWYIHGLWNRTPENRCPWLKFSPITSELMRSPADNHPIPVLPDATTFLTASGFRYRFGWVSITLNIAPNRSTLSNGIRTFSTDAYDTGATIIGFPVVVGVTGNGITSYPCQPYTTDDTGYDYSSVRFPRLDTVMSDIASLGGNMTADAVTDISFSWRCPFKYHAESNDSDNPSFAMYARTSVGEYIPVVYNFEDGKPVFYYIRSNIQALDYAPTPDDEPFDITVDEQAYMCGSIGITDSNTNIVANIPMNECVLTDGAYHLTGTVTTYCDFNKLYTVIATTNYTVLMQDTHLPYVGSAWDSYKAYSQSFDREAMQYSIDQAHESLNVQTNAQIANAIISTATNAITGHVVSAATGAASTAINVIASYRQQQISDNASRFNQDLAERRLQVQPGTAYALDYGLCYLINTDDYPISIQIMRPYGLTDDIYNSYTAMYGYPAEGEMYIPIEKGFYQGIVLASEIIGLASSETVGNETMLVTGAGTGIKLNRLNEAMMNGIRFV